MALARVLFLCCLVAAVAGEVEYGADCVTDFDCLEDSDFPYCVTVKPRKSAILAGSTIHGPTTQTASSSGTPQTETQASQAPVCGRSDVPAKQAVAFSPPASEERKCAECSADRHCGPGAWCVLWTNHLPRPAGSYGSDSRASDEASNPDTLNLRETGIRQVSGAFSHEEYGGEDEVHEVGFCVDKGWPLGEECSDNIGLAETDGEYLSGEDGVDNNLFCGFVSEYWSYKCRERGFYDPEPRPKEPAKIVQWVGACVDRKCYECEGSASDSWFTCSPSGLYGTGGYEYWSRRAADASTLSIDRNAEAQILVVQLVFIILIFFVSIGILVKSM